MGGRKKKSDKRKETVSLWLYLLSSTSEGLFSLEVCLLAKFCISGELSIG